MYQNATHALLLYYPPRGPPLRLPWCAQDVPYPHDKHPCPEWMATGYIENHHAPGPLSTMPGAVTCTHCRMRMARWDIRHAGIDPYPMECGEQPMTQRRNQPNQPSQGSQTNDNRLTSKKALRQMVLG